MNMKFKSNFSAVAIVALLGVVLSAVVFLEIRSGARERFSVVFQKLAKDRTGAVFGELEYYLLEMKGLRRFYEQSVEVTGREFELYTGSILLDPGIQAVEWIPRVRQNGRAAFEARTGIRIREQDADGLFVSARERAEYFPIELAEPFKLNESALGFDLGSNPERLAALEAVRDHGETSAMEMVRLVESPANPPVFMLVAPVYCQPSATLEDRRRNLDGFVLGMCRLDGLVMHTMEQVSIQGLAFMLEDLDAAPGNRLLYRHDPRIGTFDWDRAPDALWKHEERIDVAGRNWRMTVFPNDVFIRTYLSRTHWWILPCGILLTLFVAMLLRMQLHGRLKAERFVRERTAALRESEDKFRRLAENAPDMIYRMSLPDGRYEYVGPASTEIFGYPPEKFLNTPLLIQEVVHPDSQVYFKEQWSMLLAGEMPPFYEYSIVHGRSGETRWLHQRNMLIRDDAGRPVAIEGIVTDVTERKQAEEALRESEEKFRALYDNAPLSYQSLDENGCFLDVNPSWLKILGYEREEVIGNWYADFLHPDWKSLFEQNFAEFKRRGSVHDMQFRIRHKDGHYLDISFEGCIGYHPDGSFRQTYCVFQDITERKRVELLLARQTALLNDTQRLAKVGGWQWNVTKQTMVWTDELYRIHGFSPDDFEPGSLKHIERSLECYDPEDRPVIMAVFERCAVDGQSYDLEFPFTTADGCRKWIRTTARAIQENGRVARVFGNMVDITERKKAEEVLRAERDKLKSVFESMDDGVYIVNQEYDIEYVNPVLVAEFGPYEGRKCHAYFHGREEACPWCKNPDVFAGKTVQWEWTSPRNGRTYDLLDTPLTNTDGSISKLEIFRDVTEHRKAEEAQKESEARFRGMFENMSSGVAIYEAVDDGNDFVFVDFNPAAERIEKFVRADVIGKRLTEVFPATEGIGIFGVFQRVWCTGVPEHFPVTFYKDDRIEGWRENYIYRLPSGEVVAVYDDMTAQKQAEQEREHAYAFLQTVIDGFPGALMVINLDYTIALANRTTRQIGEAINPDTPCKKCHCISHGSLVPCDDENHPCPMKEVLATKAVVTVEHIHTDAKGNKIPVEVVAAPIFDESGEVVQIIETSSDITNRKRAEAEKDRLMAAIDQAAETVVITDLEGSIQYVNPAFERITGYTREEAIGRNPRMLKSGEQDAAFYLAMWKTLTEGETWSGRFVNRKKDGTFFTEEVTISPVKDPAGKIVNYVAIKSDITAELSREEQLRQSQKMESVGRLAGGVAHDFNNILQTITGFCELILAEMDDKAAHRQDVDEIQKAAHHAGELTRQLLTFSRKQPTDYQRIDLNAVLSEGQTMLRQALDDSFKLHFTPEPRLEPVHADASQILQIAMNLTVNARDAMPEGGTITLRTKNLEIQEKDLSDWPGSKVGNWVCFSLSDTGCGMDEKQLSHLFEPFYTTKAVGKGTGLGLSVVYGIVEKHGGWISVSSESGKGSIFKVCLPVHDAVESHEGDGPTDPDAFRGKQILLVEDDAVVRELTAEILQDVGYAVSVAADVAEAEQLFAGHHGEFDLLFSDVVLPDGNGIELAGVCRERQPGLPVLLFSGDPDKRTQVDRIQEKGFNYIRKPFNLKKLLDTVSQTITGIQG